MDTDIFIINSKTEDVYEDIPDDVERQNLLLLDQKLILI